MIPPPEPATGRAAWTEERGSEAEERRGKAAHQGPEARASGRERREAEHAPAERAPVQRTRVVLAEVAQARQAPHPTAELTQQSQVGDALLRGLIRAQLAHALRLSAVVLVGLGGLPLLFAVAPTTAAARPFGMGLPWLLLGVAAYPFLFAVGAMYLYLAERTEADFVNLVLRHDDYLGQRPGR